MGGTAPPLCAGLPGNCWPPPLSVENLLCSGGAGGGCRAGAAFALPGPKSSKLDQMQEHKLKVCAWDLSLGLTMAVLAEKQVGRKIGI